MNNRKRDTQPRADHVGNEDGLAVYPHGKSQRARRQHQRDKQRTEDEHDFLLILIRNRLSVFRISVLAVESLQKSEWTLLLESPLRPSRVLLKTT